MSRESDMTVKWWRRKRRGRSNHSPQKLEGQLMKELVGDPRLGQDKPEACEGPVQMGMATMRPTTYIGKYFVEFASNLSVHGINHLVAPHRHVIERILTVLFVGGAFLTAVLLSWYFWDRYQNDAIILVIDHRYISKTYTIVPPSIMTCPLKKINATLFPEVFERYNVTDTPEARQFFVYIADASYTKLETTPNYTKVHPDKWLTILFELKNEFQAEIYAAVSEIQKSKEWVITEGGFCLMVFSYVSLYISYNYWMENNWTVVQPPAELPSLTFFNRENVQGITIHDYDVKSSFHNPLEVPEMEDIETLVEVQQHAEFYFDPQSVVTSNDVISLPVWQRKCKVPEERGLRLWPIYTRKMCILECRYEIIRTLCGCYPHFVRPTPGVPVCTAEQLQCVGKKRRYFARINRQKQTKCGCYANCNSTQYSLSSVKFTTTKKGSPSVTITRTSLIFPHDKIRREVLFSFNDFLAAVGGSGGLFLGASVLSFAEILYFLTIHLFWYLVQLRREKKVQRERRRKTKVFYVKNAPFIK